MTTETYSMVHLTSLLNFSVTVHRFIVPVYDTTKLKLKNLTVNYNTSGLWFLLNLEIKQQKTKFQCWLAFQLILNCQQLINNYNTV